MQTVKLPTSDTSVVPPAFVAVIPTVRLQAPCGNVPTTGVAVGVVLAVGVTGPHRHRDHSPAQVTTTLAEAVLAPVTANWAVTTS